MVFITEQMITSTIRLSLIVLLSGLIGIEREMKNHPAGLRTHMLVGVGSCLLMLVSLFGFEGYLNEHPNLVGYDPSRIPSYVISGIGFLGAGTILVHRGITVKGLTTAASIWVVAGLGLVVGIGMFFEAILTTLIIITTLFFLNKLEALYKNKVKGEKFIQLSIVVKQQSGNLSTLSELISKEKIEIVEINSEEYEPDNLELVKYTLLVKLSKGSTKQTMVEKLQELNIVHKVRVRNANT
ncbi:MgtC/SapB family protein [Litchfieldia salsa]|uniref:Putative Mg2+ transporter-C (MgtC) family protein n=1 Tax=Litchfieldia salsa TaxID=930152 RepID=A0A1H0WV50_9BACI|nr:putative Mg2+ transporter-C (MgtC) family protein [Litchfieldia salsa]